MFGFKLMSLNRELVAAEPDIVRGRLHTFHRIILFQLRVYSKYLLL